MQVMKIRDGLYKKETNGFQWSWKNTGVTLYVFKHITDMRSSCFIYNEPLLQKEGHYTPDMCWEELTEKLLAHNIFCEPITPDLILELPPMEF